jgi:hypothetical protein
MYLYSLSAGFCQQVIYPGANCTRSHVNEDLTDVFIDMEAFKVYQLLRAQGKRQQLAVGSWQLAVGRWQKAKG